MSATWELQAQEKKLVRGVVQGGMACKAQNIRCTSKPCGADGCGQQLARREIRAAGIAWFVPAQAEKKPEGCCVAASLVSNAAADDGPR